MEEYSARDTSKSITSYPTPPQAWAIFGVIILGQLVASPFQYMVTNSGLGTFLMYSVALSIGLAFALWQKSNSSFSSLDHQALIEKEPVNINVYLLCVLLPICMVLISGPLAQLMPVPDFFLEQIEKILGDFGIFQMLTIVLAAPFFEELIFRGIILDGFLKQFSPRKAILYSSFLFALIHMNPWQFPHTFLLGCVVGWVYYRTRSIWPCIWIHFVNNGLVFLSGSLADMEGISDATENAPSEWLSLLAVPIGVMLLYGVIQLLNQAIGVPLIQWQEIDNNQEEE